jgi:hypothetical protein
LPTEDRTSSQIGVEFCDQNILLVLRIEAHEQDDETLRISAVFVANFRFLATFFLFLKLKKYCRMISLRFCSQLWHDFLKNISDVDLDTTR